MYALLMGGRSAKFGVMVCKASMVDYQGVHLPGRLAKYEICQVWCNSIQGIYAQLGRLMCQADLPNMRSAKFGVMVFMASMVD